MEQIFRNRLEAGAKLAEKLHAYANDPNTDVLGIPRGGVPVGFALAEKLHLPLDVWIVRKLGSPGHRELAIGAIASGGVRVINPEIMRHFSHPEKIVEEITALELPELERRERLYRGDRSALILRGRAVILADDGLATGASMRAAVAALRKTEAARIVVAVPVGALETCAELKRDVDELVCGITPAHFHAVGEFYEDFSPTTDDEVRELLALAMSPTREFPPL